MSGKTDLLLEEILKAAACNYMSDLHSVKLSDSVLENISRIPEEQYELEAWKEAVSYITGEKLNPRSIAEAKAVLNKK